MSYGDGTTTNDGSALALGFAQGNANARRKEAQARTKEARAWEKTAGSWKAAAERLAKERDENNLAMESWKKTCLELRAKHAPRMSDDELLSVYDEKKAIEKQKRSRGMR